MQATAHYHVVNYYTLLDLAPPYGGDLVPVSKDELKAAYHRALLSYHPDKAPKHDLPHLPLSVATAKINGTQYSIDNIMRAYQTLADPVLKAKYDAQLSLQRIRTDPFANDSSSRGTHLGVETFDLEELEHIEESGAWTKACRCGNEQGYTVDEVELERECKEGEIYVGCRGCSLFIKVLFDLDEEDNTA